MTSRQLARKAGLLEERQGVLTAQQSECALTLFPRPGPERIVRQVDLLECEDLTRFHDPSPYSGSVCSRSCATPCVVPLPTGWSSPKTRTGPSAKSSWPCRSADVRPPAARCARSTCPSATPAAHAALLSCPTWLWGAEHGVNEFGVAIGNERVATVHDAAHGAPRADRYGPGPARSRTGPHRRRTRSTSSSTSHTHGQGGIADAAHHEAYDSSFLIADATQAFVLDTSGTDYAAAPSPVARPSAIGSASGSQWTHGLIRDSSRATTSAASATPTRPPTRPTCAGGEPPFPRRAAGEAAVSPPPRWRPTCATTATGRGGHRVATDRPSRPRRVRRIKAVPASACTSRSGSVTAASFIAVLPRDLAPAHRCGLCGFGQPVREHLRAGLRAHGRRTAALCAHRALQRADVVGGRRAAPTGGSRPRRHRPDQGRPRSGRRRVVGRGRCGRRASAGVVRRGRLVGCRALAALQSCAP